MAGERKTKSPGADKSEPIEKHLWKAADKLRKNIDAAEYKYIVLGLIFLKYISDSFEELYNKLKKGEGGYSGAIAFTSAKERSADVLGHVFEYFLGEFALAEANYAWIQHFLYHLNPSGIAGFVLAKGSLTSKTSGEGEIRKALIEARLVDCIVNLPAKLFLNTQIPACLWFLNRNKANSSPSTGSGQSCKNRVNEILFIDARNEGHLINRRTKVLSEEDIQRIAKTYQCWKNPEGKYEDIKSFCNSASIERVKELDYVLTPGRYVGLPDDEEDFNFNERFLSLKSEFEEQLKEETRLNALILENLAKVKLV